MGTNCFFFFPPRGWCCCQKGRKKDRLSTPPSFFFFWPKPFHSSFAGKMAGFFGCFVSFPKPENIGSLTFPPAGSCEEGMEAERDHNVVLSPPFFPPPSLLRHNMTFPHFLLFKHELSGADSWVFDSFFFFFVMIGSGISLWLFPDPPFLSTELEDRGRERISAVRRSRIFRLSSFFFSPPRGAASPSPPPFFSRRGESLEEILARDAFFLFPSAPIVGSFQCSLFL